MKRLAAVVPLAIAITTLPQAQPEKLDLATIARIKEEGLKRSQVMDHISWLSDVYGPRLTGGSGIMQASEWVIKKFSEWELSNPHREHWPFGKGWSLVRFSAHMIEPQVQPLIGFPASWTPGTSGTVTADVVRVQIDSDEDFEKYRGQLAGKVVLTQPARPVAMLDGPIVLRMTERDFQEAATVPEPADADSPRGARGRARRAAEAAFRARLQLFFKNEGVVALFDRGSSSFMTGGGSDLSWQTQRTDGGTIFPIEGRPRAADPNTGVPAVTLAVEHYNRMVRVLDKGIPVKVEINIQTAFHDETTGNGFNILAELPGIDPVLKDEVVLLGAHFDSVAAATGATDNAAGSAAMMEAMRILKAVGVKPRRTIRIGLWGGEEQGLLGSRAYVREHLGDVTTMQLKPAHAQLSAYFNSDNGTGRIRGIWLQGNQAVRPIFEQWMAVLKDLGVVATGPRSVDSTDHVPFDAVGIPAFQFMVDRLEYNSRTHHSNMDMYDRVQAEDMVQQATVAAVFAYLTAMRDEQLPRKPLPAAADKQQ
jgi:carboxypeptidase Q